MINGSITLTAGEALAANIVVKLSSGNAVAGTANAVPVGISKYAAASGALVAIDTLNHEGTLEVIAGGAISQGADVYVGSDGKVTALSESAGTYYKVGVALEAATESGQKITIIPCPALPAVVTL